MIRQEFPVLIGNVVTFHSAGGLQVGREGLLLNMHHKNTYVCGCTSLWSCPIDEWSTLWACLTIDAFPRRVDPPLIFLGYCTSRLPFSMVYYLSWEGGCRRRELNGYWNCKGKNNNPGFIVTPKAHFKPWDTFKNKKFKLTSVKIHS